MAIKRNSLLGNHSSEDNEDYKRSFRKQVFKLLLMGYRKLKSCSTSFRSSEEPDITGELVRSIREVIDSSCGRMSFFSIHDDPPVNDPSRKGKRRKRIDLEFERSTRGPHPRFSFEAKRLYNGKTKVSDYLGESGVGEFIIGNYASNQDEAGMLGYVQENTPGYWATEISQEIALNAKSLLLCKNGNWACLNDLKECDCYYKTEHHRPTLNNKITIFHFLLDFS